MPRPCRIRFAGAKYHLTARGNARQRIFYGKTDYERFLGQLVTALEKDGVRLYAYCLMPNHYHLLVETPQGNVDRFEQRLNTAYSMYFRFKHDRPGHCFQGRYGGKLVEGDDYIVRLTRYIHLNPVATQAMARRSSEERIEALHGYRWSSFRGYVKSKQAEDWVDYRWLASMGRATDAGNRRAYCAYAESMVGRTDPVLDETLEASRYAIGDDDFIARTEAALREETTPGDAFHDLAVPSAVGLPFDVIERAVSASFGCEVADLHIHGRSAGVAKAIAIELCCRFSGVTQRAVAQHFGYKTDAGISRQRHVLRAACGADKDIRDALRQLTDQLAGASENIK